MNEFPNLSMYFDLVYFFKYLPLCFPDVIMGIKLCMRFHFFHLVVCLWSGYKRTFAFNLTWLLFLVLNYLFKITSFTDFCWCCDCHYRGCLLYGLLPTTEAIRTNVQVHAVGSSFPVACLWQLPLSYRI